MDAVKNALENYLNSDDTLAFQINGPWGSGKTFYILDQGITLIKKIGLYPIYFFLNGQNDIQYIKKILNKRILYTWGALKSKNYKWIDQINTISDIVDDSSVELNHLPYNLDYFYKRASNIIKKTAFRKVDFSKFVIILDDLERISEPLTVHEVFGCINNLMESLNCKIIIISNENQASDKKELVAIKEKVINKTVYFGNNSLSVAKKIIECNLKDYEDWFESINLNSSWFINIFENLFKTHKNINLRTIQSVIDTFIQVLNKIKNENLTVDESKQFLKTAYTSILVLTYEYKLGKLSNADYLKNFFNLRGPTLVSNASMIEILQQKQKKKADQEKKDTVQTEIIDKFHNKFDEFDKNIVYTNSIYELVLHDIFDLSEFKADIDKFFFKEENKASQILNLLQNYRSLSENSLQKTQEEALAILSQDIGIQNIINICLFLLYQKRNGLLFIKFDEEESLNSIKKRIFSLTNQELESIRLIYIEYSRDDNDFLIEIRKTIDSALAKHKYELCLDALNAILSNKWYDFKRKNPIPVFEKMNKKPISLFELMLDQKSIEKKLFEDNNAILGLETYLNSAIVNVSNAKGFYFHEIKYAGSFLTQLEKDQAIINNLDKVMQFNIKELKELIQACIDHLK
ncbi:hypothetical protein [Liquorilactobacillus hordei]|uniref:KAP NTPase domain-containing protein n=1 Tax=Liquorilactobacillus hordei TaxID=468911 RepID=A0A3S6QP47_9LACO|nr:hypothetical protein [Liquorilactobacillus hordei]AUJ29801.1 hypothetical protein BSQ49_06105 [Liquorilactobacillus hordei]